MRLTILNGIRFLHDSTNEYLHSVMPQVQADIRMMKKTQLEPQKYFIREDKWKIKEVHDVITVTLEKQLVAKKKKFKYVYKDESSLVEYGLLAELDDGRFALFMPRVVEGHNRLVFTEVVNREETNLDPPGIVGQATFRTGWAKTVTPNRIIEQVRRVDQGYYAYDGDIYNEDVTYLSVYDNIWTRENIPYTTRWISVDPGPPPPAECGYTWAIAEGLGGPGGGDFSDEKHLFFNREVGIAVIQYHWPPEFNQKIVRYQYINRSGCIMKFVSGILDDWWDVVYDVGIEEAAADYMFLNSATVVFCTWDETVRMFGNLWGTISFSSNFISSNDSFPYKTVSPIDYYSTEIVTPYGFAYLYDYGVYVKEGDNPICSMFIQGAFKWDSELTYPYEQTYCFTHKREAIDISKFVVGYPLTDRQLILMEGNEDLSLPWVQNYWSGLYEYACGYTSVCSDADLVINCAGDIHIILSGMSYEDDFDEIEFEDYGIFTKCNTGLDEHGEVDYTLVDPIYAYVLNHYEDEYAIFGMVLNGVNYITDLLPSGDGIIIAGIDDTTAMPLARVASIKTINSFSLEVEYEG